MNGSSSKFAAVVVGFALLMTAMAYSAINASTSDKDTVYQEGRGSAISGIAVDISSGNTDKQQPTPAKADHNFQTPSQSFASGPAKALCTCGCKKCAASGFVSTMASVDCKGGVCQLPDNYGQAASNEFNGTGYVTVLADGQHSVIVPASAVAGVPAVTTTYYQPDSATAVVVHHVGLFSRGPLRRFFRNGGLFRRHCN